MTLSESKSEFRGLRLMVVVTADLSVRTLLRGQLEALRLAGFDVTVISGGDVNELQRAAEREGVAWRFVAMDRELSPRSDIASFAAALRVLHEVKPHAVVYSTPKASLVFSLAAWVSRVPARIYTLRGLRFETTTGPYRWALIAAERLTGAVSHRVLCVSESVRVRAEKSRVVSASKTRVAGCGSSNGVDVARFQPANDSARILARRSFGIPSDAVVAGFVGRLTHDKGADDLIEAIERLGGAVKLLVVGSVEAGDPVGQATLSRMHESQDVSMVEFLADTTRAYAAMDLLVLPSYREGFPNVPLEAASCGIPSVVYACTGCVDAVVNGATGLIVPVGDIAALSEAIRELADSETYRLQLGAAARERARDHFSREEVWSKLMDEYRDVLRMRAIRRGAIAKRLLDVVASLLGLFILSPILAVVALLVRNDVGTPVLFRQYRPGFEGRLFRLIKFRTMVGEASSCADDADRLTPFGSRLRAWSLDELPELWNVLLGQMSLVGPRPLLPEYIERYSEREARRHWVKPGITGWAQVNGRNAISWNEKLALDVWYADNRSFAVDIRILWRTAAVVFSRGGISADGVVTARELRPPKE